jgi:Zn-dependent protease with chaperone function
VYLCIGLVLGLVTFLAWNGLISLLVILLSHTFARSVYRDRPRSRARLLLGLRLAPTLLSAIFVFGFFAPSYLLFEPMSTGETVSPFLAGIAVASLIPWGLALWRGLMSWRAGSRLVRSWLQGARPVAAAGLPKPFYRIAERFPVVSLVGIFRPRVFVAGQVLDALIPDELGVALAHEAAHGLSRDNLKRVVFQCSPDVLGLLPAGRWLKGEWERACEEAADAAAAGGDVVRALNLSSALVKVARLWPEGVRTAWGSSALHDGEGIECRIRRLLASEIANSTEPTTGGRLLAPWGVGALAAGLSLLATHPPVLGLVHEFTEYLIHLSR